MQENWNHCTLLVEMQNDAAAVENSFMSLKKVQHVTMLLLTQLCPTLCDPNGLQRARLLCGILQARILEWIAMPSSRRVTI